jgi:octaheme c-type cytochrome (tetrathionate reductase family)
MPPEEKTMTITWYERIQLLVSILIAILLATPASAVPTDTSTADHSKFEQLQRDFATGPEVTQACLECHTEAAKQLHKTSHWTWAFENQLTGQTLGKKNVLNNFCVATATNWPRCTSCHIGYGWKDDSFDLSSETNVDCLVCHDTTGSYKKFPTGAGHPNYEPKKWPPKKGKVRQPPDLQKIAQNVGKPNRSNCGACHFYGGGGDGVKHGHLDSSMHKPSKATDVHMDSEGLNFSCQTCHTTGGHEIAGSRYAPKASDERGVVIPGQADQNRATCESCHGSSAHGKEANPKLNSHTDKVACVTCHVPEFARGGRKTKMWWDWSTAGKKDANGKPLIKKQDGYPVYHFKKGDFTWEENVTPEYYWFDGDIRYTLFGEQIDDSGVVPINRIQGSYDDPDSRIWPFKVMRGKQPYDSKNKILAVPHLFGKDPDAFWKSFDWGKALNAGLMARGVEFSGEYGFVETEYFWPITHMVAPKEEALGCNDCHARDGRLAGVSGFYMPGRDRSNILDLIGWLMVLGTLGGVTIHALGRIISNKGRNS